MIGYDPGPGWTSCAAGEEYDRESIVWSDGDGHFSRWTRDEPAPEWTVRQADDDDSLTGQTWIRRHGRWWRVDAIHGLDTDDPAAVPPGTHQVAGPTVTDGGIPYETDDAFEARVHADARLAAVREVAGWLWGRGYAASSQEVCYHYGVKL